MKIRNETSQDIEDITKVNDDAFAQTNEGKLILTLRESSDFDCRLSFVAEDESGVVGHLLLSPILIINENSYTSSLALAPMSVKPHKQKQGVGSALIKHAIDIAKNLKHKSIIVLGHPEFYTKFGFRPASFWGIHCPFKVPDEVFMALELEENSLSKTSGVVQYPKAFNDV
ncbi:N-acetyltransferase [Rickettsiales bacterium]|nr:N-acetyltransferase [Rickettsiales bacterium]